MTNVVPVAREVMEAYARTARASRRHGPFSSGWVRRSKIVLERTSTIAGTSWISATRIWATSGNRRAVEALRGKRLPLLDRIEVYPIEV